MTAFKAAAYELCRLRGQDPEADVPHGAVPNADGTVNMVQLWSKAWQVAAHELEDAYRVQQALKLVEPQ